MPWTCLSHQLHQGPLINAYLLIISLYSNTILCASWNQREQMKGWYWRQSENVKLFVLWTSPVTMSLSSQPWLQLVSGGATPTVPSSQGYSVSFHLYCSLHPRTAVSRTLCPRPFALLKKGCNQSRYWRPDASWTRSARLHLESKSAHLQRSNR